MKIALVLASAATVAASVLLTSCSAPTDTRQVASAPASGGSPSSATGAPAASADGAGDDDADPAEGRPQLRLDDSPRRRTAIQVAYNQCLIDHGAVENAGDAGSAVAAAPGEDENGKAIGPLVAQPVPPSASAACSNKLPLPPAELAPATNPDFHRQSLDYVSCLEAGGLYVTLLGDENLDWTYTAGHSVPDDSVQLEKDCLTEAFSR